MGDTHPARDAGPDAGLQGRANVVDVDMDVPQPVAADHDERVPERRQCGAQSGDPLVVRVEQVHHLEAAAVGRVVGSLHRMRQRQRPNASAGTSHRAFGPTAGESGLGGVEQNADTTTARVDHACLPQDVELVGRPRQRFACRAGGGSDTMDDRG